ncbi:MAG: hypothetical protein JRI68_30355 [Deltaproteobacteria bacterium]|nr:hypothetical protein [Deltaproteobacteria bacterium]
MAEAKLGHHGLASVVLQPQPIKADPISEGPDIPVQGLGEGLTVRRDPIGEQELGLPALRRPVDVAVLEAAAKTHLLALEPMDLLPSVEPDLGLVEELPRKRPKRLPTWRAGERLATRSRARPSSSESSPSGVGWGGDTKTAGSPTARPRIATRWLS